MRIKNLGRKKNIVSLRAKKLAALAKKQSSKNAISIVAAKFKALANAPLSESEQKNYDSIKNNADFQNKTLDNKIRQVLKELAAVTAKIIALKVQKKEDVVLNSNKKVLTKVLLELQNKKRAQLKQVVTQIAQNVRANNVSGLGDNSEIIIGQWQTANIEGLGADGEIIIGDWQPQTIKGINGLGLVPAGERDVYPFPETLKMLFPPQSELKHKDLIVDADAEVEDTVALMKRAAKEYKSDTTMLANALKGNDLKQTLNNIFDFVFKYIKYVPDSRFTEQVRRPLRTIYDKKGDCDCFSLLIGSMLENLGIDYRFRIAAYNGKSYFQHVYVIVPYIDGSGMKTYYTVDPVVDRFNYEKPTSKNKDF